MQIISLQKQGNKIEILYQPTTRAASKVQLEQHFSIDGVITAVDWEIHERQRTASYDSHNQTQIAYQYLKSNKKKYKTLEIARYGDPVSQRSLEIIQKIRILK